MAVLIKVMVFTLLKKPIYESNENKRDIKIQQALPLDEVMIPEKSPIEEEIKKINPLEMTPMEAMNFLYNLKEKI